MLRFCGVKLGTAGGKRFDKAEAEVVRRWPGPLAGYERPGTAEEAEIDELGVCGACLWFGVLPTGGNADGGKSRPSVRRRGVTVS